MNRITTTLALVARRLALTVAVAIVLHATHQANAKTVFSESFEKPVVSGKADVTPAGWTTTGHPGYSHVVGEDLGTFKTPYGKQAASLYGSGTFTTTTALRAFLKPAKTYTVTFNVAKFSNQGDAAYVVELLAGSTVLGRATGQAKTSDLSQSDCIVFTPDAGHARLGEKLAVRLRKAAVAGAKSNPLFDNIQVDATFTGTASAKPKKRLKIFILAGQSNMVGIADIRTLQSLSIKPFRPTLAQITEWGSFKWRSKDNVMVKDLHDELIAQMDANEPLRRKLVKRFFPKATPQQVEAFGEDLSKQLEAAHKMFYDDARMSTADFLNDTLGLPKGRRAYIANHGPMPGESDPDDKEHNVKMTCYSKLIVGYGGGTSRIGPEYGFGIAMEERLDAPILIIKTSWGNTAIESAWRPSSAWRTDTAEEEAAREKYNREESAKAKATGKKFQPKRAPNDGWAWKKMAPFIQKVLADPGKFHPDYDPKAGYDVAGCVWFQGYSDQSAPASQYEELMKIFVKDLRKLVETPQMPFVIGVLGTPAYKAAADGNPVVQGQRAAAAAPEFKGAVTAVETYPYYSRIAEILDAYVRANGKNPQVTETELYKRLKAERDITVSNRGYHYMGNAPFMLMIGDAFAEAMVELMEKPATVVEPVPGKRAASSAPEIVRKNVKFPGLVINFQKRCVDIESSICLDRGLLELVACTKGSKEHESIVVINARPMHIHTALLLLDANSGNPAMRKPIGEQKARWIEVPPKGDPVDVYLVFENPDGKMVECPISDFITRSENRPLDADEDGAGVDIEFPHTFLFAGSHLLSDGRGPPKYLSGLSGHVISIATFGDELLCLPGIYSHDNGSLMWEIDSTHLPKVGSKVTLRLRPQIRPASKTGKALPED